MLQRIVCADRAEWLTVRRRLGLGASEAAAAINISPFASPMQVWLEKTAPRSLERHNNPQTRIGQRLEQVVADHYAEETGREVVNPGAHTILYDDARPFMFATLDRIVVGWGPLECKSANFMGWQIRHSWKDDGLPMTYQVQAQHQMAVTGSEVASVAALVGIEGFFIFDVERDNAFIEQLLAAEEQFWRVNVLEGVQPYIDDSDETRAMINNLYVPDPVKTIALPEDLRAWHNCREAAIQVMDDAKAGKTNAESHIILALGDAKEGYFDDGIGYRRNVVNKSEYTVKAQSYTELRQIKKKERK